MSGLQRQPDFAQVYGAQVAAQGARASAQESLIRSGQAKRNAERLYLITQAMWELMSGKLGLTDKDLEEKIREIDLRDGKLDGQNKLQTQPLACVSCGRTILSGQKVCSWCGALAEGGAFTHEG